MRFTNVLVLQQNSSSTLETDHSTNYCSMLFWHCDFTIAAYVSRWTCLSLSTSTAISPGAPEWASTTMSPFWNLLELRMVEVVVIIETIGQEKLQSNCHHQKINTELFTGQMPFLLPNQQCQSTGHVSMCLTNVKCWENNNLTARATSANCSKSYFCRSSYFGMWPCLTSHAPSFIVKRLAWYV